MKESYKARHDEDFSSKQFFNPSNAEATFVQSIKDAKIFLKTM